MGEDEIELFSDDIFNEFCYGDPFKQRSMDFTFPSGKMVKINEWVEHASAKRNMANPGDYHIYNYWISENVTKNEPKICVILSTESVNIRLNRILKDDIGWLNIR
jgi:hypothetical protein